jgi:UDP:flavonoid glycosyltransferase YjiC (YdhE family)
LPGCKKVYVGKGIVSTTERRKRVLFVAENATMAQVVRLVVLACALDPVRYEVHFACSGFDPLLFAGTSFAQHDIFSLPRAVVEQASAKGKPIYSAAVLERYVAQELALFARVKPDAVVGDFRLSLSTSTALARIPFAMLINAYWSPHAVRDVFPVPDHPMVRLVGEKMAAKFFPRVMPKVFAAFAKPINTVRKRHGLAPIGSLLEVLTHGDRTLFPDTPSLVPTTGGPPTHVYLGPVLWSPEVPLPQWWNAVPDAKPIVYVTLGSSGKHDRLPIVLKALAKLDVSVLLSTAGRDPPADMPPGVFAAPYLPGDRAVARSALVISNGGSTTGYQALAGGVPVLGIASNLDQFLAMTAIATAGAGLLCRAGSLAEASVRDAVGRMLREPSFGQAAMAIANDFSHLNSAKIFESEISNLVS